MALIKFIFGLLRQISYLAGSLFFPCAIPSKVKKILLEKLHLNSSQCFKLKE